jgi:hypothetical protein
MSRSVQTTTRLTRWWVRRYTWRLPPEIQADRQAEIDSDLWEHQHDAAATGRRPIEAALEIVGRLVLGVPADLLWRHTQRGLLTELADLGTLARKGGTTMLTTLRRTWWLAPAGLLALWHLAWLATALTDRAFAPLTYIDHPWDSAERSEAIAFTSLAVVALGAGYLLQRRLPKLAAGLLVLGALPGLIMFWAYGYVVGPLLAAMVIVGALQLLTSWRPAPPATGRLRRVLLRWQAPQPAPLTERRALPARLRDGDPCVNPYGIPPAPDGVPPHHPDAGSLLVMPPSGEWSGQAARCASRN